MVRDPDGGVISRSPLPGSGDFQIEYVHSYYNAPATECFTAGEDGNFELVGVASPSEAVLDYYELEGRKEAEGELLHLVPDEPRKFEALPLIGTRRGGRTLLVSGERFPLYGNGDARHIVVEVERDTFGIELRRIVGGLRTEERWESKCRLAYKLAALEARGASLAEGVEGLVGLLHRLGDAHVRRDQVEARPQVATRGLVDGTLDHARDERRSRGEWT